MAPRFPDFLKAKSTEGPMSAQMAEILQRAHALQLEGQLAAAAAAYRSILEIDPDHWESLNAIAAIALRAGELERAIQLYDAVIVRDRDHAEAYYKRANAFNGLERWEAALA